jgi:hypothetical protein
MRLTRVLHVQAHLLNDIRHTRSSKCEVLLHANHTSELRSILHGRCIVSRQLGLQIDRSSAWFVACHASMVDDVLEIGALVQE